MAELTDEEYGEFLEWLQETRGGIGPKRVEAIREEFPDGDDFVAACRAGYETRDWDSLTEIRGISEGYARGKLALGAAEYFDWEGGEAEPRDIEVKTFDEVMDEIDGSVQPIVNPAPDNTE